VGDPETIIVDSTLLEVLHPRQRSLNRQDWMGLFLGEVGHLQRLWGQTPYVLRHKPRSHLLRRAHHGQHRGCSPHKGAFGGGEVVGGGGSEEALGGSSCLAQRGSGGGASGIGDRVGKQRGQREATRSKAANRDCLFELEASFWPRPDVGEEHYYWACEQDSGEDNGLHLRFLHQSAVRSSSREDQGVMGINLTTHI
jgi:hypothetical protein